jgi:hypothetical protein
LKSPFSFFTKQGIQKECKSPAFASVAKARLSHSNFQGFISPGKATKVPLLEMGDLGGFLKFPLAPLFKVGSGQPGLLIGLGSALPGEMFTNPKKNKQKK